MLIPCKNCGQPSESKNKFYALCQSCMQNYLNSLEEMAAENKKRNQNDEIKKQQYNILYKKIERTKESLAAVPRKIELEKPMDRECLRCGRDFVAIGKFNRICGRCKDIINTYEDFYI